MKFWTKIGKLTSWIIPVKEYRHRYRDFMSYIDNAKQIETVHLRYKDLLLKLSQKIKKQKLKIIFLNTECEKWQYQSLYETFEKDNRFEVQVIISPIKKLLKKRKSFLNYIEQTEKCYQYFKNKKMNVAYGFDFENKKYIDLKTFSPDIIFYEQPWDIPDIQLPVNTSAYALTMYANYGAATTKGTNEYAGSPLFKEVFRYFLDNKFIKPFLIEKGLKEECLVESGSLKNDGYFRKIDESNIIWKTTHKKRIIWAPHFSFFANSQLRYGTFDWNYKYMYEFAVSHPEFEFILKPHPRLRDEIVRHKIMTEEEMIEYFNGWNNLDNAQVYECGNYIDMFRTSDVMITDCNSFLFEYMPTKKPLINLINKNSVGHIDIIEKLLYAYYQVDNIEDLQQIFKKIIFEDKDFKYDVRLDVLRKDMLMPTGGIANYIYNHILWLLKIY